MCPMEMRSKSLSQRHSTQMIWLDAGCGGPDEWMHEPHIHAYEGIKSPSGQLPRLRWSLIVFSPLSHAFPWPTTRHSSQQWSGVVTPALINALVWSHQPNYSPLLVNHKCVCLIHGNLVWISEVSHLAIWHLWVIENTQRQSFGGKYNNFPPLFCSQYLTRIALMVLRFTFDWDLRHTFLGQPLWWPTDVFTTESSAQLSITSSGFFYSAPHPSLVHSTCIYRTPTRQVSPRLGITKWIQSQTLYKACSLCTSLPGEVMAQSSSLDSGRQRYWDPKKWMSCDGMTGRTWYPRIQNPAQPTSNVLWWWDYQAGSQVY